MPTSLVTPKNISDIDNELWLADLETEQNKALVLEEKWKALVASKNPPIQDNDFNSTLKKFNYSEEQIVLINSQLRPEDHLEFISLYHALKNQNYENSDISEIAFKGGVKFLHFVFNNYSVFKKMDLDINQIVKLMSNRGAIQATKALIKNHAFLKSLHFTMNEMINMTARSGGVLNIELLSNYKDDIQAMVEKKKLTKAEILTYLCSHISIKQNRADFETRIIAYKLQKPKPQLTTSIIGWLMNENQKSSSAASNVDMNKNENESANEKGLSECESELSECESELSECENESKLSNSATNSRPSLTPTPEEALHFANNVFNDRTTSSEQVSFEFKIPENDSTQSQYLGTLFSRSGKRQREKDDDFFVFPVKEFQPSKEEVEEHEQFMRDPFKEFDLVNNEWVPNKRYNR